MTTEELLAWGEQEMDARIRDLESARTPGELKQAQAAARRRAREAGLSRRDATWAVMQAGKKPQRLR